MTTPAGSPFSFEDLRRAPDVEGPNLVAVDASDRLILDEAADLLAAAAPGEVVVIGDHFGALTLGALAQHDLQGLRVSQDPLVAELALAGNYERAARAGLTGSYASSDLNADLVRGARVVLLQLPRGLAALDEIAALVAAHAAPDVVLLAGGRLKHMTLGMNEVLGRHFGAVSASLARQKSRVLRASNPIQPPTAQVATVGQHGYPQTEFHEDLDLWVAAHGAAFAGTSIDIGTRYLLTYLDQMPEDPSDVVDLGCGTGVLAAVAAKRWLTAQVLASDSSRAAVASALATLDLNGLTSGVEVVRDDGLKSRPAASADLILCNPPFHSGAAVMPDIALRLFDDAGRVLRPGGELWTVFNSRLSHASTLRKRVGPTEVMGDNGKFTVTRSVKRVKAGA